MSDARQPRWSMEESVETKADRAFAFRYLTSVENMTLDPGIERVDADSPYRDQPGIRGRTYLASGSTVDWVVADVKAPEQLAIEVALADATLRFDFRFDDRPGGGSVIAQRVSLFGANAEEYVEQVESGFGSTLRDGMQIVRDRIDAVFDFHARE
jgi:hypothetical protein